MTNLVSNQLICEVHTTGCHLFFPVHFFLLHARWRMNYITVNIDYTNYMYKVEKNIDILTYNMYKIKVAHYPTAKFLGEVYAHSAAHFNLHFVKLLFLTEIVRSQRILPFSVISGIFRGKGNTSSSGIAKHHIFQCCLVATLWQKNKAPDRYH